MVEFALCRMRLGNIDGNVDDVQMLDEFCLEYDEKVFWQSR